MELNKDVTKLIVMDPVRRHQCEIKKNAFQSNVDHFINNIS